MPAEQAPEASMLGFPPTRKPLSLGQYAAEAVMGNDGDWSAGGLDLLHLGDGDGLHGRSFHDVSR